MSIYDYEVQLANGETYSLAKYRGQAIVIVNTATKCGYSPQFADLQKLYATYAKQGLMVLGFPSNQFKQELKDSADAEQACRTTYGVTFPMHEIGNVNGSKAQPLFDYLTHDTAAEITGRIKWNFTKFLVDRQGNVVERFDTKVKPEAMVPAIERVLNED
ncbi:glutathione peroxidase [Lapidilactobacillus wuchangensis]|uniref:glutathione peroxidase n=1 Tax=Lapidilactobacillus wuchangensis TaxID=2486001 RepID=UPI000F78E792|nr:glutathione peroxidase [Lapidilactobacillus wuchangensis]